VLVQLDRLDRLVSADPDTGRVVVQGGLPLHRLNALLAERGLGLTNMGDIDAQTVTGAISTGTHGTGRDSGALATQVVGLELVLADGSVYPHRGTGYPAGLGVDPRTGTITVKGVFPNPGNLLRPGQYARVRVETDVRRGATTVPQRALQDLQGLAQIAVVGADQKVEVRTVQPGPSSGTLRVIEKGVAPGESVIVEGFQKVQPGMIVSPSRRPPSSRARLRRRGWRPRSRRLRLTCPRPRPRRLRTARSLRPSASLRLPLPGTSACRSSSSAVRSSRWSSPS